MLKLIATEPHNKLPVIPPDFDIENKNILKACIASRTKLESLRVSAEKLPNQSVLINTLPLLEAQSSSEIENIVTTADKLFQYSNDENSATEPATKEALRYRSALLAGYRTLNKRPITTRTAEELCSSIKNVEMRVRSVSGTSLKNSMTNATVYTPPVGEDLLREKLANWEDFVNNQENIDPLIIMAVAHYQFEAIHPFTDGNGRTGRILNLLHLIDKKLLDIPILYLSRYILNNRSEYYQLIQNVTENGDWEAWILFMLKAVSETADWTSRKIEIILRLMSETKKYVKSNVAQAYSYELVELLFVQPYCRNKYITEAGIAKRQTAAIYLKKLAQKDVLYELKAGREKLYINKRFLNLMLSNTDSFEQFPVN